MKWYDIEPKDALDIDCRERPDLDPPLTQEGEVCPWPWEPQQLVGVPMGQYHCGYCGEIAMAGVRHLDFREQTCEICGHVVPWDDFRHDHYMEYFWSE